jgi:hypothetical protein
MELTLTIYQKMNQLSELEILTEVAEATTKIVSKLKIEKTKLMKNEICINS